MYVGNFTIGFLPVVFFNNTVGATFFCLAGCAPEQLLRPDESQAWLVAELRNIFMKTNRTFEFECGMRRADRKR